MSKLVVVSNRVQPPVGDGKANQGGLAVALLAALREKGGVWFGWSGETTPAFTGELRTVEAGPVSSATVDLEPQDVHEYYNGFANRTLWPLFHDRIDLTEFERDYEGGYVRVNRRFADTVRPLIGADDLVWIHDYHLIPLGEELRRRGVENRMGFFLHIPWPQSRILLSLPHHEELVRSLFAYDVVGFHTRDWLDAFREYAVRQLGAELEEDCVVRLDGRTIRAIVAPIGIDAAEFEVAAAGSRARFAKERMQMSLTGRQLLVGVDRLDYSKGLPERFGAYERFLARNPDLQGLVSFLQVAPPSREKVDTYQAIRAQLDSLSGRINGEYADIDWTPIRYVNRGYGRDELAGIYRAARVALVTPLRDGMNLVAKEYVAAQDPADPGVLVLSMFAGAAAQLTDALIVNPFSADDVADGVARALAMPREERVRRWEAMMSNIRREDVFWWRDTFLSALEKANAPVAV